MRISFDSNAVLPEKIVLRKDMPASTFSMLHRDLHNNHRDDYQGRARGRNGLQACSSDRRAAERLVPPLLYVL